LIKATKGDIRTVETAASSRERENDDANAWEPEFYQERFAGLLTCTNCRETIAVAGDAALESGYSDDVAYVTVLTPRYVMPSPRILSRPVKMPNNVEALLSRAERLLWSSPAGAANALRAAIEAILTDRGIARSVLTKKRKRQRLDLHARILIYGASNAELAKKMIAVKWIGNAGSHDGEEPTDSDIDDCFVLVDHVLEEIYDEKSKRLESLAKKITKRKGPLSRVKRHK